MQKAWVFKKREKKCVERMWRIINEEQEVSDNYRKSQSTQLDNYLLFHF